MHNDQQPKNKSNVLKRYPTKYPGVFYRMGGRIGGTGEEKIYYAVYRKEKKLIETKLGRQFSDDMTPSRANNLRNDLLEGRRIPQADQARLDKQKAVTVSVIFERYITSHKENKSLNRDINRFKVHLSDNIGNKTFVQISPQDIQKLKTEMKLCSPKTIRNVLELVVRLSNFSVNSEGQPGLNFKITYPKINNETTEDLTQDQFHTLMKVLESETDLDVKHIMLLAICTGMRRSEILKLAWADINFERGIITIRNPKSGIDKTIPMNDMARDAFNKCVRYQSDFVFPGRGGGHRKDVHKATKRIMRSAGVQDDFRPMHGLRHFFATNLICNGVDLAVLQKLMTHSSPQMTLRYAKIRDKVLADASNIMTEIMGRK
jgi:integrase